MTKPIYLDYCATTPIDPRVLEAMTPYLCEKFGNSMSHLHPYGWDAESAIEKARLEVSECLRCHPKEIFFTSGATESNNWALQGLVNHLKIENPTEPIHIISSSIEHKCILNCLEHLHQLFQVEIDLVLPSSDGVIDLSSIKSKIKPHTKLISIMAVNNETGTINPIHEIAEWCRQQKIYFHTDATQALGKTTIDLGKTPCDLLSFSGHKIYGPKGAGVLFIRSQNPKVQLRPLLFGGGQERGQRGGTLNTPAIVGLGKAVSLIHLEMSTDSHRIEIYRKKFLSLLESADISFKINGSKNHYVPSILNITFHSRSLVPLSFSGLAVSRGSACSGTAESISHVLKALGLTTTQADQTIRFSIGRMTSEEEILKAAEIVISKLKTHPVVKEKTL